MKRLENEKLARKFLKLINSEIELKEILRGEIKVAVFRSPLKNKTLIIDNNTLTVFDDKIDNFEIIIYNHRRVERIEEKKLLKEIKYIYGNLIDCLIEEVDR